MPVQRAPTKIKRANPLATPAPVVLSALLVHPVVRILQLLVQLEPMPVVNPLATPAPVELTALLVQHLV